MFLNYKNDYGMRFVLLIVSYFLNFNRIKFCKGKHLSSSRVFNISILRFLLAITV